jgi:hypothetical protein
MDAKRGAILFRSSFWLQRTEQMPGPFKIRRVRNENAPE